MNSKLTDHQLIEAIERIFVTTHSDADAITKVCELLMPSTMPGVITEIRLLIAALDTMIEKAKS